MNKNMSGIEKNVYKNINLILLVTLLGIIILLIVKENKKLDSFQNNDNDNDNDNMGDADYPKPPQCVLDAMESLLETNGSGSISCGVLESLQTTCPEDIETIKIYMFAKGC
jgi:hypothetical protein